MTEKELDMLFIIPHGKQNAVKGECLDKAWKVGSRERYGIIQRAREQGEIICSCSRGYYYPETTAEMLDYYHTAKSKALTILTTLKKTRQTLKKEGLKV